MQLIPCTINPVKVSCPGHAQQNFTFADIYFPGGKKYHTVSCKGADLIALWRTGTVFTGGMAMRTEIYLSLGNGVS